MLKRLIFWMFLGGLYIHINAQTSEQNESEEYSVFLPKLSSSIALYYEFDQGDSVIFDMEVAGMKKIKQLQVVHLEYPPSKRKDIYHRIRIAIQSLDSLLKDLIKHIEVLPFDSINQRIDTLTSNGLIRGAIARDSIEKVNDSINRIYVQKLKEIDTSLVNMLDSNLIPVYNHWEKVSNKWDHLLFSGYNNGDLKAEFDKKLKLWQKENKESVLKLPQEVAQNLNQIQNSTIGQSDLISKIPIDIQNRSKNISNKVFELTNQLNNMNLNTYIDSLVSLDKLGLRNLNMADRYVSALSVFSDVIKSLVSMENYNGKRIYTAQNADKLENQLLRISMPGIYAFTFRNGLWRKNKFKIKRYCNLNLQRIKPPQDSIHVLLPISTYITDSVLKVDTNSLALVQASPTLTSNRNIFGDSRSSIVINLQADSISQANVSYLHWAYWVGIGENALDTLNKFAAANAENWAPYNVTDPLIAYALGLTKYLPANGAELENEVNYTLTNDFNRRRFLNGKKFSSLQLTEKAPQYNKFDKPLTLNYALIDYQDPELVKDRQIQKDGSVFLCLENVRKASAIQVYVRVVGLISVKTEERVPVQHPIIKPKIFKISKE